MPHGVEQWCWFAFYTVGAVGGWLGLAVAFAVVMRKVRRGR